LQLVDGIADRVCATEFANDFVQSQAVDRMNRIYRMGFSSALIFPYPVHLVNPVSLFPTVRRSARWPASAQHAGSSSGLAQTLRTLFVA
jgi:hypothetical protein